MIKSIEFNINYIDDMEFKFLNIRHCFYKEQTYCLLYTLFNNWKQSIISAYVLTLEISKINTYVKGHKWIETTKHF